MYRQDRVLVDMSAGERIVTTTLFRFPTFNFVLPVLLLLMLKLRALLTCFSPLETLLGLGYLFPIRINILF